MTQKNIRNFAIIAHVDHGKSTLADRFLEITNTIQKDKMQEQFLDQNPISRERGITIKLAPVRMNYILNSELYTLNLIDTPGHIDFSYEVSRTLAACEGAVLLVDATQGIQAQTVAHFNSAKKENLTMIPVINKIDLESASILETEKSLIETFGFKKEEIVYVSGKTGQNVPLLLKTIIERIPAPKEGGGHLLKALVFDAFYDEYKGVIAYVRIMNGDIRKGARIKFIQEKSVTEVLEVGYFSPFLSPQDNLSGGEIGYLITGIKNLSSVRIGDTITLENSQVESLPGYKLPQPMVFFGVYPKTTADLIHLKEGLSQLALNDTSLEISQEHSAFLGNGFRVGFLGLLHAEVVKERLKREEGVDAIFTLPHVLYEKRNNGMLEPYMNLTIYTPISYVGSIMTVCQKRKGKMTDINYGEKNVAIRYQMPYSMLIRGLSSEIKNASAGFASLDYEITGYREADIVSLDIKVNDVLIDVLSEYVYSDEANYKAREKASALKNNLPRKQFKQIIQAVVGSRILAREEVSAFRKDVLAKMSGGDRRRKDKLLEKQKKGKEKLTGYSKVDIPQEALLSLIKSY